MISRRELLATAGSMALLRAAEAPMGEFIFDTAPFPACHASTIVELANGDLMAAWFGGTAEKRPDVAIWGATQSNGKWSPLVEMAREPNTPCWNPVLFYTKDNRLWFYYKFGTSPSEWSGARQYSTDNGKTWSPVEHLPAGLYGPIRAKPLVMDDGTVVSGTSVESYHSWAVWIERSTDNGKTFRRIGPITVPGVDTVHNTSSSGLIQPSVISMGGNHLRLYARSTSDIGQICVADSKDAGQTWTDAHRLDLPNPSSGIDAVALKDGRIILIYNHTKEGRSPLNLAVSKDGEKFTMFRTLEDEPKGEFSYPNVIQARDGDLHLTYTWQRKKIRHVKFPLKDVPR